MYMHIYKHTVTRMKKQLQRHSAPQETCTPYMQIPGKFRHIYKQEMHRIWGHVGPPHLVTQGQHVPLGTGRHTFWAGIPHQSPPLPSPSLHNSHTHTSRSRGLGPQFPPYNSGFPPLTRPLQLTNRE